MSVLVAIILGLIQGITEFLPVSSSGHVLLLSRVLGSPTSFEFDVLVSFGTLLAVVIYYHKRLVEILLDLIKRRDVRLALSLVVATIPAVIAGFFFKDIITTYLHSPAVATTMLLLVGVLMVLSSRWKLNQQLGVNKDLHKISTQHALLIGLAQCVSLISGTSRSGITMLAALRIGFNKRVAAEWSFLMSIPIIAGASLRVLVSDAGMRFVQEQSSTFIIANVVSFMSGMLAIHLLLKILQHRGLYWFGIYRIVLAVVLFILMFAKIV